MRYWKEKGVYTPEPSFPFGNAQDLIFQKDGFGSAFERLYRDLKSRAKPYGGYYFFARKIFLPTDAELIKDILTVEHFTDRIFHSDFETDPLSEHLPSLKGDKWRAMRTKLSPAFTPSKNKMMLPNVLVSVQDFLDVVDDLISSEKTIPVNEIVSHYTMDTVVSSAFGLQPRILKTKDSTFIDYATKFFDASWKPSAVRLLTFIYPDLLTYFKVRSIREDIATSVTKVFNEVINYREDNDVVRQDFVHLLLQIRNNVKIDDDQVGFVKHQKNNQKLSLSTTEIIANCFIFFIAGYETSSSLIRFCLYALSVHQDIQKKARDEVLAVLERHDGIMSYDALQSMEYLNKCIKETLRRYPPIPIIARECVKPYKVPHTDLIIEKGTPVIFPVYAIHNDPDHQQDPDKFDPERFSHPIKQGTWIPFGGGSRKCIALQFGLMQSTSAIAAILKNYEFKLNPKTKLPITFSKKTYVLRNENEIFVDFTKLNEGTKSSI